MHRSLLNAALSLLPPTRFFTLKKLIAKFCKVEVGNNTCLAGGTRFYGRAPVVIGSACWIGLNVRVYLGVSNGVSIGNNCDIAPDVVFHTGTHDIGPTDRRAGRPTSAPIEVGDGTWIGTRAVVLAGARIGSGCVVAAGSVVISGEYPNDTLLVGVPAKPRRRLD